MKIPGISRNEADFPDTPEGPDAFDENPDFADFEYSDWLSDAEDTASSTAAGDWLLESADDGQPDGDREGGAGDDGDAAAGDYFDRLNDADVEFILSLGDDAGLVDGVEGEGADLVAAPREGLVGMLADHKAVVIVSCAVVAALGLGGVAYGYTTGAFSRQPVSVLQAPAASDPDPAPEFEPSLSSSASSSSGAKAVIDASMARMRAGLGQVGEAINGQLLSALHADEEGDSDEEDEERSGDTAQARGAGTATGGGGGTRYEDGGGTYYDSGEGNAGGGYVDQGGSDSGSDSSAGTGSDGGSYSDGAGSGAGDDGGYGDVDYGGGDAGGGDSGGSDGGEGGEAGGEDYGADA